MGLALSTSEVPRRVGWGFTPYPMGELTALLTPLTGFHGAGSRRRRAEETREKRRGRSKERNLKGFDPHSVSNKLTPVSLFAPSISFSLHRTKRVSGLIKRTKTICRNASWWRLQPKMCLFNNSLKSLSCPVADVTARIVRHVACFYC